MAFRVVAFDLDNTLLDDHGGLSEENAQAVRHLVQQGVRAIVATGKHPLAFRHLVRRMGLRGPDICLNGAALWVRPPGRLEGTPMARDVARRALSAAQEAGLQVARFTERAIVVSPDGAELTEILLGLGEPGRRSPRPLSVRGPVWKLLTLCPPGDAREAALRAALDDATGVRVVRTSARFVEIVPAGVSKGAALLRVLARLGVPPAEALAFGDHLNDVEMLAAAGYSVTFEGSPPEVIQVADRVVAPGPAAVAQCLRELGEDAFAPLAPS